MRYSKVFKSGNTHRVTLPRSIFQGLKLRIGDLVSYDHVRDGVVELRNNTRDVEQMKKQEAKKWKRGT
jgi:antitoxin component of MazEF toxin-antitoxin module